MLHFLHMSAVAGALVQLLNAQGKIGLQLNISGSASLTCDGVVRISAQALNRHVQRFHIQECCVFTGLQFLEQFGLTLPIKAE